jgi:nitroimidazol reductase NimA-like FMN-containing flavoprotein (pyridoxamine 5'-phosphate oxidase superfamily)
MYQHPDVACSYSMNSKSVLVKGKVTFIENLEEKEQAMNLFMKKYTQRSDFKYSLPALRNVKVWKVKVESITAKAFGQNFKTQQ